MRCLPFLCFAWPMQVRENDGKVRNAHSAGKLVLGPYEKLRSTRHCSPFEGRKSEASCRLPVSYQVLGYSPCESVRRRPSPRPSIPNCRSLEIVQVVLLLGVFHQARLLCERLEALRTLEGSFARVGSHVPTEITRLEEALLAHLALVGYLTRVYLDMSLQRVPVTEPFEARFALEKFFPGMYLNVFAQGCLVRKRLRTKTTLPLVHNVRVLALVSSESLRVRKLLVTVVAVERFGYFRVTRVVTSQALWVLESFPADLACVGFFRNSLSVHRTVTVRRDRCWRLVLYGLYRLSLNARGGHHLLRHILDLSGLGKLDGVDVEQLNFLVLAKSRRQRLEFDHHGKLVVSFPGVTQTYRLDLVCIGKTFLLEKLHYELSEIKLYLINNLSIVLLSSHTSLPNCNFW